MYTIQKLLSNLDKAIYIYFEKITKVLVLTKNI